MSSQGSMSVCRGASLPLPASSRSPCASTGPGGPGGSSPPQRQWWRPWLDHATGTAPSWPAHPPPGVTEHRQPSPWPLPHLGGGAASTHHADLPRGHSDLTPSRFFCCVLSLGLRVRTFAGGARLSWPCPRRVLLVLSGLLPLLQPVSSACAAVPQPAAPHLPPLWPSFGGGWLAGLGLGGHGLRREPKLGAEPGCHWAHPRGRRWI